MKRRDFIAQSVAAATVLAIPTSAATAGQAAVPAGGKPGRFKLKYAPSFGQFKALAGDDLVAQIQFAADQGLGPCSTTES